MKGLTKNAVITLAVGLALNILLGTSKLVVGVLSGSTSVTSDSLNNLSDAAVSLVTIIATALAARRADRDHPFGHGRYEYIATFVVSAGIIVVAAEALIGGIKRIITPEAVEFGAALWATLGAAIAVKAFMAVFYFVRAHGAGADTLKAAAADSASDAAVTTVVLCCALAERFTGEHIDGYASVAVSLVIAVFAVAILKKTVSRLLGERPDTALYETVREIIVSHDSVISAHDIVINDYGEANKIAEADAEFPADMAFVEVHAVCDRIEREVLEKTGIRLCLHADPSESDARVLELRARIESALEVYGATAHDISVDDVARRVELDIKLADGNSPEAEIIEQAKAAVLTVLHYDVIIHVDYV